MVTPDEDTTLALFRQHERKDPGFDSFSGVNRCDLSWSSIFQALTGHAAIITQ